LPASRAGMLPASRRASLPSLAVLIATASACPQPREEPIVDANGADGSTSIVEAGDGAGEGGSRNNGPPRNSDDGSDAALSAPDCDPGFHRCGAVCVDNLSPLTCSSSCEPCPGLAGGRATCDGIKCGVACPPGQQPCLDRCIDKDAACDNICPAGKNACGGVCVDATSVAACGSACLPCPTSANGRTTCTSDRCELTCNSGYHRCGEACVTCAGGDGCCPPGCHAGNDADCMAVCGNGVKESGEACDPLSSCPSSCPPKQCQLRKLVNAGSCQARCEDDRKQTACSSGDDCCPSGCNSTNDQDCPVACGNGIKEKGETCDPPSSCPDSCPAMGCQLRELVNAGTCKAACHNSKTQTTCASGDGCCPAGCNNTNDGECPPKCGNGVLERGESCEPVAECTRRQAACQSDQGTIRSGKGDPNACTFECVQSPRACGPGDGVCPPGCGADPDCQPRPASCVHIQWCRKPDQPNQGRVICITNDDSRCTDSERINECAHDATVVCGAGHVKPVVYSPPIAGMGSG
jgi:hypothetical protein